MNQITALHIKSCSGRVCDQSSIVANLPCEPLVPPAHRLSAPELLSEYGLLHVVTCFRHAPPVVSAPEPVHEFHPVVCRAGAMVIVFTAAFQ